jgi:hypothetical protein
MNDTESCQTCELLSFCLAHGPLHKLPQDTHPVIVKGECSNCGKPMQALAFPSFSSVVPRDLIIQISKAPECRERLFRFSTSNENWIYCNECQKGEN